MKRVKILLALSIYGTERLRVVVQRLTGEQSCSQPVDGRQVDRLRSTGGQVDRLTCSFVNSIMGSSQI